MKLKYLFLLSILASVNILSMQNNTDNNQQEESTESQIAAYREIREAIKKDDAAHLKKLLGNKVNQNSYYIHTAAEQGACEVLKFFLDHGIDPNVKSNQGTGYAPLFRSACANQLKACEILLKAGANINDFYTRNSLEPDDLRKGNITPIMHCCENKEKAGLQGLGSFAGLVWLWKQGADLRTIYRKEEPYTSALYFACTSGNTLAIKFLLGQKVPYSVIHLITACYYKHLEAVKCFVDFGADINEIDQGGSALMIACMESSQEMVKYLMDHKANTKITNEWGANAHTYASGQIRKLLENPGEPDANRLPALQENIFSIKEESKKNIYTKLQKREINGKIFPGASGGSKNRSW